MSKTKWKDTPLLHKVVTIISILASLSVVVLAVLQMFNVWDQAINVFILNRGNAPLGVLLLPRSCVSFLPLLLLY